MFCDLCIFYTRAPAHTRADLCYSAPSVRRGTRTRAGSMRVGGPLSTALCARDDNTVTVYTRYRQMDMLDAIPSGAVIIVEPGNESSAAHWGELMTNTALQRGAKGIVINGGLRDSLPILDVGFPAFRKYYSPLTAAYRWNIDSLDLPIKVGNVTI